MDKETQAELDRLEKEIWGKDKDLTEIINDDVLKDLEALLGEEAAAPEPVKPASKKQTIEDGEEEMDDFETFERHQRERASENLTIGLLITGILLCMGICGMMIYWLENFL